VSEVKLYVKRARWRHIDVDCNDLVHWIPQLLHPKLALSSIASTTDGTYESIEQAQEYMLLLICYLV
jgi:hypothetical protein